MSGERTRAGHALNAAETASEGRVCQRAIFAFAPSVPEQRNKESPMPETNLQILLKCRPVGAPVPEDFDIVETAVPDPGEGQVLVRAQ